MTEETSSQNGRIPDAVVAVVTQFILGIALATSAVPPSVLSFQDRASETMGVFLIIIITSAVAFPLRMAYGLGDISNTEYILAVLAPIATRLDLGLLMWVNINKALLWVEQIMYVKNEELECVQLLILASQIWHDGDNRIQDPEFGLYGGEAGKLMKSLQDDYNPKNASGNILAWLTHITLWPFAAFFHVLLQFISILGFLVFWFLQKIAALSAGSRKRLSDLTRRATFLEFVFSRRQSQNRKLFMRHEVSQVFDSNQSLITSHKSEARHKWAMLASVDAIVSHSHFGRTLSVSYPMRAAVVFKESLKNRVNQDLLSILNKEYVFFQNAPEEPLPLIGDPASKQMILYRVLGWPDHSTYSASVLQRLKDFSSQNMTAWDETRDRLKDDSRMSSEFTSVFHVLRRALVQLVVLAWCDGLGQCKNDEERRLNNIGIADDLMKYYLKGRISSIEMCVRLINLSDSPWNDHRQSSRMILSLITTFTACSCSVCQLMVAERRLDNDAYLLQHDFSQLKEASRNVGCGNAEVVCDAWENAVRSWVIEIFEP